MLTSIYTCLRLVTQHPFDSCHNTLLERMRRGVDYCASTARRTWEDILRADVETPAVTPDFLRTQLLGVREQTRCLLAVLVMAAEWRRRFPEGWVTATDISAHGLNAGGQHAETRGRAIRRAWQQLEQSELNLPLESEPGRGEGHATRRRLSQLARVLADWLYADGHTLIVPGSWHAFLIAQTTRSNPDDEIMARIDEFVADALGSRGRLLDGLKLIARRLGLTDPNSHNAARLLVLGARLLALRERGRGDSKKALAILNGLARRYGNPRTVEDRLQLSRIHIALTEVQFLSMNNTLSFINRRETRLKKLSVILDEAEAFASLHGPRERASLLYTRGRIAHEAMLNSADRHDAFAIADRSLREALDLFASVGDFIATGDAMYWIGVLHFDLHQLWNVGALTRDVTSDNMAFEPKLRASLQWFEAAHRLLSEVAPDRGWEARSQIAFCHCLLITSRFRAGRKEELSALLADARAHIDAIPRDVPGRVSVDMVAARLDQIGRHAGLM